MSPWIAYEIWGKCPVCGWQRKVRMTGEIYSHNNEQGNKCPGSGQIPKR